MPAVSTIGVRLTPATARGGDYVDLTSPADFQRVRARITDDLHGARGTPALHTRDRGFDLTPREWDTARVELAYLREWDQLRTRMRFDDRGTVHIVEGDPLDLLDFPGAPGFTESKCVALVPIRTNFGATDAGALCRRCADEPFPAANPTDAVRAAAEPPAHGYIDGGRRT